jgi:plasmid stabilization system protein ParE
VKIRFTRPALTDLAVLTEYIAARSPQGARHVRQRIKDALDHLSDYPMLGKQTDDPTIRRLTTIPYPYLIFYEVTDAAIIVHAVRHSARDPGSMPDA